MNVDFAIYKPTLQQPLNLYKNHRSSKNLYPLTAWPCVARMPSRPVKTLERRGIYPYLSICVRLSAQRPAGKAISYGDHREFLSLT